ncbi:hypothetical protein L596_020666 [Steinernema carpocapsae]|nr:hypothetical protein L596_020666 [Steinernema carpocapsae]
MWQQIGCEQRSPSCAPRKHRCSDGGVREATFQFKNSVCVKHSLYMIDRLETSFRDWKTKTERAESRLRRNTRTTTLKVLCLEVYHCNSVWVFTIFTMGACIRKPKKARPGTVKRMPSTKKVDMDNMRQLFREFDTNGDGFIQKNELRDVMTKLSAGVPPTDEELDQMFDAADANHDGNIDFNEFLTIARSNPGTMTLRDMFAQFDKDDDGYITP